MGFPALSLSAGGSAASINRVTHHGWSGFKGSSLRVRSSVNHGVGSVIWFLKEIVWDDFHSAEGRGALHRGTEQSQAEALPAPSTQKHACPLAPQSAAAQEPTASLPVLNGCRGASFLLFSPKPVEPTARPRACLTTLALASQETER